VPDSHRLPGSAAESYGTSLAHPAPAPRTTPVGAGRDGRVVASATVGTPGRAGRAGDDACPGVLRLLDAADGSLARIRLVGGFLTAHGLSTLADAADDLGDGRAELTSRGNVQLRGLPSDAGPELGARLHAAGLWPSPSHERVRNIVATPLAGLDRDTDLTALVHALDASLCATPRLAELSGRFLFALDDGRGDVAGLGADVVIQAGAEQGGRVNGLRTVDPVATAIAFAEAFLDERAAQRSAAWRISDLIDGPTRVRARVPIVSGPNTVERTHTDPPSAGLVTRHDGGNALVLAVPLGRLDSTALRWLAQATRTSAARVTPWRSVVLPDADVGVLEAAAGLGFGVSADTPWAGVSACAGRPGCAKALADVQADARAGLRRWPGRVVHWSGCERRCGRSARTEIDVVATATGYRIEGQ
jgi:precorrin-3B synthase